MDPKIPPPGETLAIFAILERSGSLDLVASRRRDLAGDECSHEGLPTDVVRPTAPVERLAAGLLFFHPVSCCQDSNLPPQSWPNSVLAIDGQPATMWSNVHYLPPGLRIVRSDEDRAGREAVTRQMLT